MCRLESRVSGLLKVSGSERAKERGRIYLYIDREREREIYIYIYVYTHIYIYIYIYVLPPTGQETLNNSTHLFKGGPPEAPSPEINPRSVPVGGLGGVCPWHAWKGICTSGFTSLRPLGYKLNLLEKLCVAVVLLASHPCIVCRLVPADSRFLPEDVLRRSDRAAVPTQSKKESRMSERSFEAS